MATVIFVGILIITAAIAFWLGKRLGAMPHLEDGETMRRRTAHATLLHLAYARRRAEWLAILKEEILIESEEGLYAVNVVCRRQYEAMPTEANKERCGFNFNNVHELHKRWEELHDNSPALKKLHDDIGDIREALFILDYGTTDEALRLMNNER